MYRIARFLRVIVLLSTITALPLACQNKSSPTTKLRLPTASPEAERTITLWHALDGSERAALEEIRRNFETAHPALDVQLAAYPADRLLETFRQEVLAGAGPDLLIISRADLPELVRAGLILPLDSSLLDAIITYQAEFVLNAAMLDETPYGVAVAAEFPTLYYRRSLFTPPLTSAEELLAQIQTVGAALPPTFTATAGLLVTMDSNPFDDDGPSPEALHSYFTTLARLAAMPTVHFTADPGPFIQGEVALLIASSSDYSHLRAAVGDDLGVATWPAQTWRVVASADPVVAVSLNITRPNAEAAASFLSYLVSPDAQALWFARTGAAPANPSALAEPGLASAWTNALRWGWPLPFGWESTLTVLDRAVAEVVLQGLSADEAVEQALSALPHP